MVGLFSHVARTRNVVRLGCGFSKKINVRVVGVKKKVGQRNATPVMLCCWLGWLHVFNISLSNTTVVSCVRHTCHCILLFYQNETKTWCTRTHVHYTHTLNFKLCEHAIYTFITFWKYIYVWNIYFSANYNTYYNKVLLYKLTNWTLLSLMKFCRLH